jgi:hypothetical protein
MFDIAGPWGLIRGRNYLVREFSQAFQHGLEGNALTAGNIEGFATRPHSLKSQEIRLDDVLDIGKIARLCAITIDDWWLLAEERLNESRQYGCIERIGVLAWPKDIEVA